jgi:hypothetical protein
MDASAFGEEAVQGSSIQVLGNEVNTYTVSELDYIRESIEGMNKFNQIEALRLLSKYNDVTLNENKYGVHINLSELSNQVLDELSNFIKYVNTQENCLLELEKQKEAYKSTYFSATKENI